MAISNAGTPYSTISDQITAHGCGCKALDAMSECVQELIRF